MEFFDPTTHHAFVVRGYEHLEKVDKILRSVFGIEQDPHPDFFVQKYTTFGIDDARMLRDKSSSSAFAGGQKIFLVCFSTITHDAQNALLKILEEPTPKTTFVFVVPRGSVLLPTFLSRVEIVLGVDEEDTDEEVVAFMKMDLKEKLTFVGTIVEEKDRMHAYVFVTNLIGFVHKKGSPRDDVFVLGELTKLHSYILDPSSSLKLLLEHTALVSDLVT